MIIALTIVFAIVFFAIRVAINDAIRSIGSDRRARKAQDRYVERWLRDIDRR